MPILASVLRVSAAVLLPALAVTMAGAAPTTPTPLPGTNLYTEETDLADRVLTEVNRFLRAQTDESISAREKYWQRDSSSPQAYVASAEPNREKLRQMIGVIDPRLPFTALEYVDTTNSPALLFEGDGYSVHRVRWPVFDGVWGEGLLVQPRQPPAARLVVLPDADQTPEMLLGLMPGVPAGSQFARQLAYAGCQLIIPTLLSRSDAASGNVRLGKFTNQPHREWIYRQAFELGRHVIGYEVQKVLAAVDWLERESARTSGNAPRIGVAGYGEGGLIAFYSAAIDPRISVSLVSGYFGPRQELWREPIYRNVFGLLQQFGDAEIASLIVPRRLVIEPSRPPIVSGPPPSRTGRTGAAPGSIAPANVAQIRLEALRGQRLVGPVLGAAIELVGADSAVPPEFGSAPALERFLRALAVTVPTGNSAPPPGVSIRAGEVEERQTRQVRQLEEFTQKQIEISESDRAAFFWAKAEAQLRQAKNIAPAVAWSEAMRGFREKFWSDLIGRFPAANRLLNPRTRLVRDEPRWRGYLVVLDVWPEVITWGYLLVPKDLAAGERRPAVVCQHGGSSTPETTMDPASRAYAGYAIQLVEQGYVVYSGYNVNYARGRERMNELGRLANPIGRSVYAIIAGQHERVLDFLGTLSFVDPARIGFYGLSYGGKTAVRIPALLARYAVVICSGDFNEWVRKTVDVGATGSAGTSAYHFSSYMYTADHEIPEFNLGRTFSYAEMAAMIAPRPFMVERGHHDRVGSDEWVAYEYAKVFRLYNSTLKLPERTTIEYFDGGHQINGQGTFEFLRRHLQWPH